MCFTMLYCASLIDVSQLAAYPVLIPVYLVKYLFNTLVGPIETFALVEAASREVKCGSCDQNILTHLTTTGRDGLFQAHKRRHL